MPKKTKSSFDSELEKIKFLFLPYIKATILGLIIHGISRLLIDFFLNIQIGISLWEYWLSGGLGIVLWLIFLRNRINLYKYPQKGDLKGLVHFLLILFICIPLALTQIYIGKTAMTLKKIDSVSQIDPDSWHTCYQVKNMKYNPKQIHGNQYSNVSGKHNQHFNINTYFLVPFNRKANNGSYVWIGKKYHQQISNRKSSSEKLTYWEEYYQYALKEFTSKPLTSNGYLVRVPISSDLRNYTKAIHRTSQFKSENHIVFEYTDHFPGEDALNFKIWIFITLFIGSLLSAFFASIFKINTSKLKKYRSGKSMLSSDEQGIRDFILLRSNQKVLAILILTNLIYMIVMLFMDLGIFHSPQPDELLIIGGLKDTALHEGQYWRLVTSMFMHSGLLHFVNNMVMLYMLGSMIEDNLKSSKFLLVYLLSGILAGIIALPYHPNTVMVGASGAIFGLIGWILSQVLFNKKSSYDQGSIMLIALLGGVSLLFGFITSGVSNAAHISGLIIGFCLGLVVRGSTRKN